MNRPSRRSGAEATDRFRLFGIGEPAPFSARTGILAGGAILTLYYALGMLHAQARPGASRIHPEGWWGWFDQGQYLRSIQALARLDFSVAQHWYPLGYPLLGALFERAMPVHPFLLVDLACLLASFVGFVSFARNCGFPSHAAVAAFLLGALGSESVRENWVIPWTTTPASAAVWIFLALCVRQLDAATDEPSLPRWRRVASIGLVAAAVPLFRPTDLLMPAIGLVLMLWWGLRDRSLRAGDPIALLSGAAVLLVPYGLLYLRIYGPHPSQYMVNSRTLGFRFGELPFKTILLLISPRPWFPFGSGLLERLPWMAAGFAGMLLLPGIASRISSRTGRRGLAMLALMLLAYLALFFSYVDLLPSGLWLYNNVHYFKWAFPGFALFGLAFLDVLLFGPRRPAILALLIVLLLSGIRLVPVPAAPGGQARMVQYGSGQLDWNQSYMGHEQLSDRDGRFDNVLTMRVLPDSQGVRVISLSRPFTGHLVWRNRSGLAIPQDSAPKEWAMRVGFGWPCWLPPYPCRRMTPGS